MKVGSAATGLAPNVYTQCSEYVCKHSLCSWAGSKYVHLKLHGTPKLLLRLFPSGKSSRVTVIVKKFWNLHRKKIKEWSTG